MFITVEGPEGAGKSTLLPRLAAALRADGLDVVETRNPGGTPIGRRVREIVLDPACHEMVPLVELMLYAADRAQHVAEVVKPALARGAIVLCDRFSDSTLAYQGYGRGLDPALIGALDGMARDGILADLTLLLDLPVDMGMKRVAADRPIDRIEQEKGGFHERLRAGFLAIAAAHPDRVKLIDATAAPEAVLRACHEAIARRLAP